MDVRPKACDRPTKRKKSNHLSLSNRARPQGVGTLQNGQSAETPPDTWTASSASIHQQDTGPPTPQAAHDPVPQLHNTDADRSGHYYVSTVQHHTSDPVVGSSANGPYAMSIAGFQPIIKEDSYSPPASSPSLKADPEDRAYNPSPKHEQQWSVPNPSVDINEQPHFHPVSQPHPQQQPELQSVSPHFIPLTDTYPSYYPPQQEPHGLSGEEHINGLPANAHVVVPLLNPCQPPSIGGGNVHLHLHQHHHQQAQQRFYQVHQGPQDFPAEPLSFQAVPVQDLPLATIPYTPQFEPGHGSHYPHNKPHIISVNPNSYFQTPMVGGEFIPAHQQVLADANVSQSIGHCQNASDVASGYAHMGEVTAGQLAPPPPHGTHSYCLADDNGKVDLQHPANHDQQRDCRDGDGSIGNAESDAPRDVGNSQNAGDNQPANHSQDNDNNRDVDNNQGVDVDNNKAASRETVDSPKAGTQGKRARSGGAARNTKKRGAFTPKHRQQTADTRKTKACTRCRTQKMRCDVDLNDPKGPCRACQSFSKTSKKTIHLTPCFRGKITDAVLYRSGGLELTRRWPGTQMKDVPDRVNPMDIRTIELTLGVFTEPIVIRVVRFVPQSGDITARYWKVKDTDGEVKKKRDLEPYCLADIHATARYFEYYITTHARSAMQKQRTGPVRLEGGHLGVIEKTYLAAIRHHDELKANIAEGEDERLHKEKTLLHNLFVLWFAIRHTTGSSYICGKEKLGMKPETGDDTYPLFGKVSVPRMILAQFDSINHTRLLAKYGKLVLTDLEALLMRNQPRWWFTIYLCLFILLREATWIMEDRYRHARHNYGASIRYSIPAFVENLQEGCNNLLQHWHYFNCKPWPDPATPWNRHKSLLAHLASEQYDLVMETMTDPAVQKQLNVWRRYKEENGYIEKPAPPPVQDHSPHYQGPQSQYDWDHPFYWISQLFEPQWRPHPTYQREPIPRHESPEP